MPARKTGDWQVQKANETSSRVVVITGAAGGIGKELTRAFLAQDFKVGAMDLREPALKTLSDELQSDRLLTIAMDVTKQQEILDSFRQVIQRLGQPAVLVNVAGTNLVQDSLQMTEADWNRILALNLTGTFFCTQAALPYMLRRSYGRIINLSSIFGIRGQARQAVYSASKAGVIGLTRALAVEFADKGITVNAVAPVATLTERVRALPKDFLNEQLSHIPMGRFGSTDDVVHTVLFLASEGGSFYTGQTFSPNGGDTMP